MDDTSGQLIFAVGIAAALALLYIGLEKAAERWRWFRIAGGAAFVLILAVVVFMGARLFMYGD